MTTYHNNILSAFCGYSWQG